MRQSRAIAVFLLLAMLVVNNVHLPVMQVAAWSGMLVSYSRDNSIAEAIEMTFGGERPCEMCCAIEKAQTTSSNQSNPEALQGSYTRDICGLLAIAFSLISPAFTLQHYEPGQYPGPQSLIFPPPNPPPISA